MKSTPYILGGLAGILLSLVITPWPAALAKVALLAPACLAVSNLGRTLTRLPEGICLLEGKVSRGAWWVTIDGIDVARDQVLAIKETGRSGP